MNLDDRWITIGKKDKEGERHGVHVLIDDNGNIVKGPDNFIGHNVENLPSRKSLSEGALGKMSKNSSKEDWSKWLKQAPAGTTVVKYGSDNKALEYMKNSKGKWRNLSDDDDVIKETGEFADIESLANILTGRGKVSIKNGEGEKWNVGKETKKKKSRGYSLKDAFAKAGIKVDQAKLEAAKDKMPSYAVFDEPELREFMQHVWAGYNLPIKILKKTNVYKNLEQKRKRLVADIGYTYRSDKRKKIRDAVFNEFMKNGAWSGKGKDANGKPIDLYEGEIKRGVNGDPTPHATIVIGYPAAGKSSSIVNKLSKEEGAFVLDSDAIKELIPEFKKTNGGAVSCVNKEANGIRKRVIEQFMRGGARAGQNLVIPIIGDSKEGVERYITDLQDAGYDIEIRYKRAPLDQSANRMVSRAVETGRIIPLKALKEDQNPEDVYNYFKGKKNARGRDYIRVEAE